MIVSFFIAKIVNLGWSNGQFTITRWDQFVNASAHGPDERLNSRIPSYNSYTTANEDFVSFYHHIDSIEKSAVESAFSLGKKLMKKSTGWFFGGNPEPEEEIIKIDPGQAMHRRSQIVDSTIRKGLSISPAPFGIPLVKIQNFLINFFIYEFSI